MLSSKEFQAAFARNTEIVKMQTQGLTHAESLLQPPHSGNCLNWVLGHLAENRDHVLELLGEPPQIGSLGERYKRGSAPIIAPEDATLPLDELIAWIIRAQEHITAALERTDEATLAREITTSNNRTATVGQRIFFLYFHETYHVGQTELFRQMAGKTDKVI